MPNIPIAVCAVAGQSSTLTCPPDKAYLGEGAAMPAGVSYVTAPTGTTVAGANFTLLPASVDQAGAAAGATALGSSRRPSSSDRLPQGAVP